MLRCAYLSPKSRSPCLERRYFSAEAARVFALLGLWLTTAAAALAQIAIVPTITTVAGNGTPCADSTTACGDGGAATSANLNSPQHTFVDGAGNLYISEYANYRVRRVSAVTSIITTVAGNGTRCASPTSACGDGGAATSANLYEPNATVVDTQGNVYIVDRGDNRIRKISASTGYISTVAGTGTACVPSTGSCGDGGAATSAYLNTPIDIAVDGAGNLYIADFSTNRIRKVTASTGYISTIAGNGTACAASTNTCGDGGAATSANLNLPRGIVVDGAGDIYISDNGDNRIRLVSAGTGYISTIAGNGTWCSVATNPCGDGGAAISANMTNPANLALDLAGNLYIGDQNENRVRKVAAGTGIITTVAGTGTACSPATAVCGDGASATSAYLYYSSGVSVDKAGNLFIGDTNDNRIRKVMLALNFPVTLVGSSSVVENVLLGTTTGETLTSFTAQQSQGSKQEFSIGTIAGCTMNGFTINPSGTVCAVPITFTPAYPGPRNVPLTAVTGTGSVTFGLTGTGTGPLAALTPGIISTVAGTGAAGWNPATGAATSAQLDVPGKLAVDSAGNIYIANYASHDIQKVTNGNISIVAGTAGSPGIPADPGTAIGAKLNGPSGLGIDSAGNIYIADKTNNRIRKVTVATGIISTVAGTSNGYSGDGGLATSAQISKPSSDIAFDSSGNFYFGDDKNCRIREVNISTGIITTVVGNGACWNSGDGGDGGLATSAQINNPSGIALDSSGNIYFSDYSENVVRKVTVSTGIISTVVGNVNNGGTPCAHPTDKCGDGESATSLDTYLYNPGSVAVDASGNIYISDNNDNRIRVVNAASGTISTLAGNGTAGYTGDTGPSTSAELTAPGDIALDSAGNLYIADGGNNVIRKVNVSQSQLTYATSTAVGTTDGTDDPLTTTVTNIGNSILTVLVPTSGNNPSVAANFALDWATTCPELTTASSPGTLAAGSACTYALDFAPTAAGSVSGSAVLKDNTLGVTGSTQTIGLTATATKGTPPITWANPVAIIYGTALSSTQLNASSTLSGTLVYSPSTGTVLSAGSQTLSVTFNPTDTANYNSATDNVALTVNSAAPAITFTVSNQTYGVSPFTVSATSNSTGAITYLVVSGPATISGSTVTITGAGSVALQASQAASGNYSAGTLNGSFTVAKTTKTITFPQPATPVTVNGTATLGATASNSDPVTYSITFGTASISGSAMTYTNAGTVTIAADSAATANYAAAATVSNTVTVNAAASAYTAPTTNVGSTSATQTAIVNIATAGTPGTISVLTQGAAGLDYAYVTGGTCATGTAYIVGQACSVKYTFNPTAPGQRIGAVVLSTSTPTVLGTSYLVGTGTGPRGTFPPGIISTIAGNGTAGYSGDGGQAVSAEVNQPRDVVLDAAGNLYISDTLNHCVRRIKASGVISTYAGTCGSSGYTGNGGPATSANLYSPGGIALDGAGNLYIADQSNNVVREVNAVTGIISTVAGNTTPAYNGDNIAATTAELNTPQFVTTDSAGNFYISDVGSSRVRKVTIATGIITTIVGNGTPGYNGDGIAATTAQTNSPGRLAFDASGNFYIPEKANHRVRMVSAATGLISTVAGTGTQSFGGDGGAATSANLNQPLSAMLDAAGNLYIADYGNSRIRVVNATTQIINTIAGDNTTGGYSGDGVPATSAEINTPIGTAMTPGGDIYIADNRNSRIRLVTQSTPATMSLPSTAYGATSAASYQTVQNTGNSTLTIASISSSSGNFTLGGASATCAASSQLLASAASCVLGVEFTPTSVAFLNGTITLTDNTLNVSSSTQTIAASGPGLVASPTIAFSVSNQTYGVSPFAVSATSNSAGAITYSVISGSATISGSTVTITGIGTVMLQASQAVNGNYTAGTQNASFTVAQAANTITFPQPTTPVTYGVAPIALSASASSGLTVTFTTTGPCSVSGSTLTITGQGSCVITANQAGNTNYAAATAVSRTDTVNQVALVITASNSSLNYGAVVPAITSSYATFVNGDTAASLTTAPTCSTTYTSASAPGSYPTTCSGVVDANYTISYLAGAITVSQAPNTITFAQPTTPVTYGVTPIALSASAFSGLTVTFTTAGPCTVSGSTLTITGQGSCAITANQAGNTDYAASTPVSRTIVVNQAPLVITASSAALSYGAVLPTITPAYATFVNGDTAASLNTAPACSTTYTPTSAPGSYPTTCSGAVDANYTISYVAGVITVSQAANVITFAQPTTPVTYGLSPMAFSASASSGLTVSFTTTGPCSVSGSTLTVTGHGSCLITANQGGNTDYSAATSVSRTITVNQAPLAIAASSASLNFGAAVPAITPSYATFILGDTAASLTTTPTCSTNYTPTSTPGSYSTTCSGAADANYTISYIAGSVTVSQAASTITFTVSNQSYGVSPFAVSAGSNSTGAITYSVVSGPATISGSTVTISSVGTVVLQASQAANGNYTAGTQNASFTVSKATPTVSISSSSNPSTYSGSITFTATVPASATGIVTFLDGAMSVGAGPVSSGAASFTTASLAGGSHSMTAQYGGDSSDNAATSLAVTEVVVRSPVTISISATENPSIYGDMVTFTFSSTGSGSAIPTGTATITEDGNALTTVSLDGTGKATYSTSAMTASGHTIRAVYNGDENYD